jgi:hypothetical protein
MKKKKKGLSKNNPRAIPADFDQFRSSKSQETAKVTGHHKSNQSPVLAATSR